MLSSTSPNDDEAILRHRLLQLDYHEDFGPESMNLVRRLLADLVQTTDSARKFKNQAERVQQEKSDLEEQVQPLRSEISRLTAENNKVHLDLIRIADERDARERRAQTIIRKNDSEILDLKFMAAQASTKLSMERQKAEEDRKRSEELISKVGLLVASEGKSNTKSSRYEKNLNIMQKIDLETGLEPQRMTNSDFAEPSPVVVDAVKIAQGRLDSLQITCNDLKAKNDDLESEVQVIRDQLTKREQEIIRLGAQLELSRSQQFTTTKGLPAGVLRTDGVPSETLDSIHQLPIARQRIEHLEYQILHLQEYIESLEKDQAKFAEEREAYIRNYEDEKRLFTIELEKEREKNAALLQATTKLDKLVAELDMSRKPQRSNLDVAVLNGRMADLERDVLEKTARISVLENGLTASKREVERLNKMAEEKEVQMGESETTKQFNEAKARISELERLQARSNNEIEKLNLEISRLREVEQSYQQLQAAKDQISQDLNEVARERDSLIQALESFEEQLNELHKNVEIITIDRDNISLMYEQVQAENLVLRKVKSKTPVEKNETYVQTETPYENVKNDQADEPDEGDKVKLLQAEVSKLQGDLAATLHRQREVGEDAGEAIRLLESERDRLKAEAASMIEVKKGLEAQIKATSEKLSERQDEIRQKEELLSQMESKIDSLDSERQRDNVQIRELKSAISDSESRIKSLEKELTQVKKAYSVSTEKDSANRQILAELDSERDRLREEVDKQAERIAEFESTTGMLEKALAKAQEDLATTCEQLDRSNYNRNQQDRELHVLHQQLESLSSERDHYKMDLKHCQDDARNLSSDLAATTKENQILTNELSEVVSDRERLQMELSDKTQEVHYYEELVRVKEEEKEHLMSSYRKLIEQNERAELGLRMSAEENSNIRMESILREKKIIQLQKALDESVTEVTQLKIDLSAYEKQCNNMTRALSTSERNTKQMESEHVRLTREISAARELALTLDRSRENIQKELAALTVDNERLRKSLQKAEADRETLMDDIRAEVS
ncbi:hypothetical protein HDV05_005785 [Chytridiales sp. JEL 0842]|nr:hypothetical protein HDV05_005785 [Chytridiales sp. JEL 0842]